MSTGAPLITKYRPQKFSEVIGHEEMIAALQRALSSPSHPHSYLFTGASGVGKTTLARIIGNSLPAEIVELDAASNSGIEAMRALVELGAHKPLSGSARRMFIIDEAHALSKAAWQATLKLLEEPPPHLYLALCTTELHKVPETVITRCFHVALRALKPADIEALLGVVAELEGWAVADDVLAAVVQAATGQPRKALSILQAVHDAPSRDEVRRIIALIDASEPLIELAQFLLRGGSDWNVIRRQLERIDDDDFEHATVHLGRYLASAMLRSEAEQQARRAWTLLDALLFPTVSLDRKASFYAAIGRVLWQKE